MRLQEDNDARARLFLGHVAVEQGCPGEAGGCYETVLAKDPASTETMLALAQLHIEQEQYALAAARCAQALETGDRRAVVHHSYLLALMHTAGDEPRVRTAFRAALAEHPTDSQIIALLDQFISQRAAAPATSAEP